MMGWKPIYTYTTKCLLHKNRSCIYDVVMAFCRSSLQVAIESEPKMWATTNSKTGRCVGVNVEKNDRISMETFFPFFLSLYLTLFTFSVCSSSCPIIWLGGSSSSSSCFILLSALFCLLCVLLLVLSHKKKLRACSSKVVEKQVLHTLLLFYCCRWMLWCDVLCSLVSCFLRIH